MTSDSKKVVLAYSGGLDTSANLFWLKYERDYSVITFTADLGQGEELEPARERAQRFGACASYVLNLQEEFVRDYVFPMLRCNARYENAYMLGTAIARPLIAKYQVAIAAETGAVAVAHGATGKGNDQVRFELAYAYFNPKLEVIAPWRLWDLGGRIDVLAYVEGYGMDVTAKRAEGVPPYSTDANLFHTSYEGNALEDPNKEPDEAMFERTVSPENAPDQAEYVTLWFNSGDPFAVNGVTMTPATLLAELNRLGGKHGIGRLDLVENRYVGMKSRGVYETPGGTILLEARRALESITLDKGAAHLKDELMPRYAELVYNGYWFSPERLMLQAAIDLSQHAVSGEVRLKLYKGNVIVCGRSSPNSLYAEKIVTFEAGSDYDQKDAEGFIRLNALRLKLLAARGDNNS